MPKVGELRKVEVTGYGTSVETAFADYNNKLHQFITDWAQFDVYQIVDRDAVGSGNSWAKNMTGYVVVPFGTAEPALPRDY